MGWQETSVLFYKDSTKLNKRYHTSSMETLAARGMKFTLACAAAVCSPLAGQPYDWHVHEPPTSELVKNGLAKNRESVKKQVSLKQN